MMSSLPKIKSLVSDVRTDTRRRTWRKFIYVVDRGQPFETHVMVLRSVGGAGRKKDQALSSAPISDKPRSADYLCRSGFLEHQELR